MNTGIQLATGCEDEFAATGEWIDWFNHCNADGYDSNNLVLKLTEGWRRAPHEKWFALIGSINFDARNMFRIGAARTLQMTGSGVFTCFANDVSFAYWNNQGSIQLSVTRRR